MFVREVTILTKDLAGEMDRELKNNQHSGAVEIRQDGQIFITRNMVLEGIWRIYEPQHVGLVDYHGSHRHYAREQLGGVNLNLRTQEEQQKQSTLYNYANKYANIKTQMATEFVLQTLREKGGNPWREPLTETPQGIIPEVLSRQRLRRRKDERQGRTGVCRYSGKQTKARHQ